MAGFTDAACRHLMADHGAAWTVSEMASAKAITFGDDKSVRLLRDKASHGIYAVQEWFTLSVFTIPVSSIA